MGCGLGEEQMQNMVQMIQEPQQTKKAAAKPAIIKVEEKPPEKQRQESEFYNAQQVADFKNVIQHSETITFKTLISQKQSSSEQNHFQKPITESKSGSQKLVVELQEVRFEPKDDFLSMIDEKMKQLEKLEELEEKIRMDSVVHLTQKELDGEKLELKVERQAVE